ncbi:MAG: hypothetical protein H0X38_00015 [Planctomycetes bacterium]|nr:hypothetical protein [Planctomycetota bacterium]
MKCLAATTCPDLKPSACSGLTVTECNVCPLDERPPQPCGQATASGGQGTTKTRHGLGPTAGLVRITYDMYSIPDRLDCFYKGVLVASTGGLVSGSATLQWAYNPQPGDPSWCLVVMSAPNSGTAWVYTLDCPS